MVGLKFLYNGIACSFFLFFTSPVAKGSRLLQPNHRFLPFHDAASQNRQSMLLVLHPSSLPPRWWSDWLKLQCTKSGNLIRWISCFYSFFEWRRKNQRLKQWSYATKKSERVIRNLPILFFSSQTQCHLRLRQIWLLLLGGIQNSSKLASFKQTSFASIIFIKHFLLVRMQA